jgi:hypothetical protein
MDGLQARVAGTPTSYLGNISTRGFVQTVENVMIGGFVVQAVRFSPLCIRPCVVRTAG